MSAPILCPVDVAHDASWKIALPEAVAQAKARGAALHLLAVVPDLGSVLVVERLPPGFAEETAAHALERLKELAAEAVPDGVAYETHVARGHAAEEIVAAADRLGAGLIVMASHAPDALRTFFVGSVADRIVHAARQSVFVVRA